MTHTKGDSPSWWEIDLAQTEELEKLIIYNRTDAEIQRLSNLILLYMIQIIMKFLNNILTV